MTCEWSREPKQKKRVLDGKGGGHRKNGEK